MSQPVVTMKCPEIMSIAYPFQMQQLKKHSLGKKVWLSVALLLTMVSSID